MIQIKRVYEKAAKEDGFRILVDRLWPRGLGKERAKVQLWLKEIAPSHALRKWFGHQPEKWEEFRKRYGAELSKKKELLREVKRLEREHGRVTLLFGRKDQTHNQAVLIAAALKGRK
jgi:uncharacterized protein YeaO (DUF488 family)